MSVTASGPQGISHSGSLASCQLDSGNRESGSLGGWPGSGHEDQVVTHGAHKGLMMGCLPPCLVVSRDGD